MTRQPTTVYNIPLESKCLRKLFRTQSDVIKNVITKYIICIAAVRGGIIQVEIYLLAIYEVGPQSS